MAAVPTANPKQGMATPQGAVTRAQGVPAGAAPSATPGAKPAGAALALPQTELRILTRQKLSELAKQIDGEDKLDDEASRLLMIVAEDFVDNVATYACRLAKHRKSTTVEVKDVQMHLERNWGIRIAGLSSDDVPPGRGRKRPSESHKQRLTMVKRFKR